MRRLVVMLTCALFATTLSAPAAQAGADWDRYSAQRQTDLLALAPSPKSCITRSSYSNGSSPLFNNCYDWHSDVHAHWALYAVSALTGDMTWSNASSADLPLSRVSSERSYMGSRIYGSQSDNPYGTAWMLLLVREREQLTGDTGLRTLGDYAVTLMKNRMDGWSTSAWTSYVKRSDYQNVSWALLNMWEYSVYRGDTATQTWVQSKVTRWLKTADADYYLPASKDASTASSFFPPALLRLAAVATIEGASASAWVNARIPANYYASYIANSGTSHTNAINFSRAFALGRLATYTGRADLRENAAALINAQMDHPTVWQLGNDYTNIHWIPQFGVLAIQGTS